MNRVILFLLALSFSSTLFAQCPAFALHGDWTVFYRDNKAPDSVLAPGSVVEIRYFAEHDQFTVHLDDPAWLARRNTWSGECVGDVVSLTGVLQERSGPDRVMVEMHRVTDERDLLARASGARKLDQLNIRVMECVGLECDFARLDGEQAHGHEHGHEDEHGHDHNDVLPAADPGHAHADR